VLPRRKPKESRIRKNQKKKGERKYYNVSTNKLSMSFSRQFFGAILDESGKLIVNNPKDDISPTLYTRYDEYLTIKERMTKVMCYELGLSIAFLIVGLAYFAAEMVNFLKGSQFQPLNV
jgi:hypothetical protein